MMAESHVLKVWDAVFRFEQFSKEHLSEIWDVFAGSVNDASGEDADYVIRLEPLDLQFHPMHAAETKPRHRGGSSSKKYFLDGTEFLSESQNRDVTVLFESPGQSSYMADGTTILAGPNQATVCTSSAPPPMLLADLVENYLLAQAKNKGWLMIHCAGWILPSQNAVALMAGNSGIGKTHTLFRHLKTGCSFFSNDRAFLRIHNGILEARSFPLPVNIGCGTIRALDLDIPHFEFDDHSKIRLTPDQVKDMLGADYDRWYPVDVVLTPNLRELEDNLYWHQDEHHPFWNRSLMPADLEPELEAAFRDKLNDLIEICEKVIPV